jgi:ribosomal peptide maturation radical SAM protein 1
MTLSAQADLSPRIASYGRTTGMIDTRSADVVLVSLPFGVLHSPSLALGILQARLAAAGISVTCRHFTLDYAASVGSDIYNKIASGFPRTTDLLGEWIFSHAVLRKTPAQQLKYAARTFRPHGLCFEQTSTGIRCNGPDDQRVRLVETVLNMAATAGDFVDYAARDILAYSPRVVGFTTVFQQNLATLGVAARLRQLDPSVKIVLGGANCEGPMGQELARTFPFIDAIISGEADLLITPLMQTLMAGEDPQRSECVRPYIECSSGPGRFIQARIVPNLDSYVSPLFDDYFRDRSRLGDEGNALDVQIPLETSRGCWWGMSSHCTFCGLNGLTMSFRSRPPADALHEIVATTARYPGARICFVDNIMDYRYYDQLLPQLAQLDAPVNLFYEIKSNVSKRQVKALKDAGVTHIQPGIESLSDQVLKIMKKGVTAVQNVQLLKWCLEFGVSVDWNVLWGFPGEDPAEYRRMAELIPLLCHLQPPVRGSEIRLDRFSPNFTRSDEFGFVDVRPYEAYYDIYEGTSPEAVFNLSYYFQANGTADDTVCRYTRSLSNAIDAWRDAHPTSALVYLEQGSRVVIVDSRAMFSGRRVQILDALESQLFLLCDKARSAASLEEQLADKSLHDITRALEGLCERGTVWFDGRRYLSLAVSFTTFLESRGSVDLGAAIDELLSQRESSHVIAPTTRFDVTTVSSRGGSRQDSPA